MLKPPYFASVLTPKFSKNSFYQVYSTCSPMVRYLPYFLQEVLAQQSPFPQVN
jgi:hypothetical protein